MQPPSPVKSKHQLLKRVASPQAPSTPHFEMQKDARQACRSPVERRKASGSSGYMWPEMDEIHTTMTRWVLPRTRVFRALTSVLTKTGRVFVRVDLGQHAKDMCHFSLRKRSAFEKCRCWKASQARCKVSEDLSGPKFTSAEASAHPLYSEVDSDFLASVPKRVCSCLSSPKRKSVHFSLQEKVE
jgi:hypothetical protein